ncbi:111aa long hypothetical protein [Pyrococcus horikoshii OT3]|uniref:Uncharacterized protein n=1 Tax=Pyrococcus horikoshii (strain ATCC 700860 / DSM 12428 / JCM 9974 / NBRC 100139 / OT-3) TaxID=70601 RepID=O58252_PYRHO|nr:111aa long hypothetical protein [Pyrococcus horikoshii OT3]
MASTSPRDLTPSIAIFLHLLSLSMANLIRISSPYFSLSSLPSSIRFSLVGSPLKLTSGTQEYSLTFPVNISKRGSLQLILQKPSSSRNFATVVFPAAIFPAIPTIVFSTPI